jgi:hypothetical protein
VQNRERRERERVSEREREREKERERDEKRSPLFLVPKRLSWLQCCTQNHEVFGK